MKETHLHSYTSLPPSLIPYQAFLEIEGTHAVDLLFAESLLGSDLSDAVFFIAFLFFAAREGHLCVFLNEEMVFPEVPQKWHTILYHGARDLSERMKQILIHHDDRWYLKRYWDIQNDFKIQLDRLANQHPSIQLPFEEVQKILETSPLMKEQKEAIEHAFSHCLTCITGGPGTGKTFTAALLINIYLRLTQGQVVVCAPTGKATSNLKKKLNLDSARCVFQTLHSFLKKRENTYPDLILVDESSMMDAELMHELFASVKEGARLILLGDPHQLPPVEIGSLFSDITRNSPSYKIELKTSLRAELEEVIHLANTIQEGLQIPHEPIPPAKELIQRILQHLPQGDLMFNLNAYNTFRVLSALRAGPFGVNTLNTSIHLAHRDSLKRSSVMVFPILITANDKNRELYNGDMGLLIEEKGKETYALFDGDKKVPYCLLPSFEWAYVLSIHKSQGSEYSELIVLLPEGSERFGREMIYTAVTRAKRKVIIYSQSQTLEKMLNKQLTRLSLLSS